MPFFYNYCHPHSWITAVNITLESTLINVRENETSEVCITAVQKDFTRTITVDIMYMDGTAIGKCVHACILFENSLEDRRREWVDDKYSFVN